MAIFQLFFFFANSFRKCLNYCATFIFSAHLAQFANGSANPEYFHRVQRRMISVDNFCIFEIIIRGSARP